jgi:hypothetical protein
MAGEAEMNRATMRRWFTWLALVALLAQAGLPTLRMATAGAGELRAEAILATALCSKPALSIADRIAALLNPWKQHGSKAKHQHCDSCPQSIDAPADDPSFQYLAHVDPGSGAGAVRTLFLEAGVYTLDVGGHDLSTDGHPVAFALSVNAIPEPSRVMLLGLCIVGLFIFVLRNRITLKHKK